MLLFSENQAELSFPEDVLIKHAGFRKMTINRVNSFEENV